MSNVRPITPNHSINEVVFVINFAQDISEKDLESLTQFEDSLKDDFPVMEPHRGKGFQVQVASGKMEDLPEKLLWLAYKRLNEKKLPSWTLRAQANFIAVNCLDYNGGWKEIFPKIEKYFGIVVSGLIRPENPVVSVTLQYVDQFIYDGKMEEYSASNIFNDKSKYLNQNVVSTGPFWHLYQGWFDTVDEYPSRILNVVNITSTKADKEHQTTIDHNASVQFTDGGITNPKSFFEEKINGDSVLGYLFCLLHETNKKVLQELLNDDRLNDIGLRAS